MDAKLIKNEDDSFTIGITAGDLTNEDGFDTAINLSLFTNKRAPDGKINEEKNNHGSLRDTVSPVLNRKHGSLLWLLEQSRLTPTNRNLATEYSQDALNWFVEDGLAKKVNVKTEIIPRLGFEILIIITHNNDEVTNHYRKLWELTGDAT